MSTTCLFTYFENVYYYVELNVFAGLGMIQKQFIEEFNS